MYPSTHCELRNEDITPLGEQDWRLRRDHFDFGVGFHNLLDAREWQLVYLEFVLLGLEMADCLLPVRSEDVLVLAGQALVNLLSQNDVSDVGDGDWPGRRHTFAHGPVYSSAGA